VVVLLDLPSGGDLWTEVILIFWCIWRDQNDVVFNDAAPEAQAIRGRTKDEFLSWRLARLFSNFRFSLSFSFFVEGWRLGFALGAITLVDNMY
jgi:hypothetical protein